MPSSGCPHGAEPRTDAKAYWILRSSDLRAGAPSRSFGASGTPYGLLAAGLTSSLCNGSPEAEYILPRFPGDPSAALYNNAVQRIWNESCRCKPRQSPPEVAGGKCRVPYLVYMTATGLDYREPYPPFTGNTFDAVIDGPLSVRSVRSLSGAAGEIESLRVVFSDRDGRDRFTNTADGCKPGTARMRIRIVRVDGLPDNCGDVGPSPDSVPPPFPYPLSPMFVLPEESPPPPPCQCPDDGLSVIGAGAQREDPFKDLARFAELLRGLPRLEVPRPPWLPKALADYFNFANLLSWMRFKEPEEMVDKNCCNVVLAKLSAVESRVNQTYNDVSTVKAFVIKIYENSGLDAAGTLSLLRSINRDMSGIFERFNRVLAQFQGVQNGLFNIYNRQQQYQGEIVRGFAATGAAITALGVGILAALGTLSAAVAAGFAATGAGIAGVESTLVALRLWLGFKLEGIENTVRNEVSSLLNALEISLSFIRTQVDLVNRNSRIYYESLLAAIRSRVVSVVVDLDPVLFRIDARAAQIQSTVDLARKAITDDIDLLKPPLRSIETKISFVDAAIAQLTQSLASFRERVFTKFDGLLECLDLNGQKYERIEQIGSGRSGSIALPKGTVAVIFKLSSTAPANASKRQDGAGQPDVIQGGWTWASSRGNLGERRPLDAENKLFLIDKAFINSSDARIVWTGGNLTSWTVSAAISPPKKKPPFEDRPCQD